MFKTFAVLSVAMLAISSPLHAQDKNAVQRSEVPGEIVVCFHSGAGAVDLNQSVARWDLVQAAPDFALGASEMMMRWQRPGDGHYTNVALLRLAPGIGSEALIKRLTSQRDVEWAAPNYAYTGDVKELIPNDLLYGMQYHHPLMQSHLAWDTTIGIPSIRIAITDDGVSLAHVDLEDNIWVNAAETPPNGVDDDGNGRIDDVNGWDFSSNDADPNPIGTDAHGTHVSGIAAGRTNNAIGIAGTAGGCTIMPVRFYGSGAWTSTVVANSFAYATNNGAKIISTSYNIDGFVGDPTVIAGFDYLYDAGVLHLNSAGNNNQLNPPRQAFHQTLLVASTTNTDAKSSFSNYGTGVDIAAPGSDIRSTLPGNAYGLNSGTSMATPNAAGVAALIWSAHPAWTRDQVAAQLFATANNIDAQNPTLVGLLGGGRANSFQGVTGTLAAPRVISTTLPAQNGSAFSLTSGFTIRFNQILAPSSVNAPGAFSMMYAGADGVFGNGDDAAVPITANTYRIGSNEVSLIAPCSLCGRYRLTANAAVLKNPFNTFLDGDGNGTGGDSWQRTFDIEVCASDITCDSQVNINDLLAVIIAWGSIPAGRADINNDGQININDLLAVIIAWGVCSPPGIPGDHFDFPIVVGTGAHPFTTVGATSAGPAITSCTNNFGRDIWYRFTPAATGTAVVNTCVAASFDSYLVAYSGACGSLTQIACNDDSLSCAPNGNRSHMTFPVTNGEAVLIRLGGWASAQGTGTLTITVN